MAKPDGAFYLFIKAPGGDANLFSEYAKQKDLLIVPGADHAMSYCVEQDRYEKAAKDFWNAYDICPGGWAG